MRNSFFDDDVNYGEARIRKATTLQAQASQIFSRASLQVSILMLSYQKTTDSRVVCSIWTSKILISLLDITTKDLLQLPSLVSSSNKPFCSNTIRRTGRQAPSSLFVLITLYTYRFYNTQKELIIWKTHNLSKWIIFHLIKCILVLL